MIDPLIMATLQVFCDTEGPNVKAGELIKIADTGFYALLDADGDLRFASAESVNTAGDYLPVVFAMLKDKDGNAGMLDYMSQLASRELLSRMRKAEGAKKASRSKYTDEDRETVCTRAKAIWARRPALSVSAVAEIIEDGLITDDLTAPANSTIRGWITELKPDADSC